MIKKQWLLFLVLCNTVFASTIYIAVSANVSYAIEPLKKAFYRTNPNTKVEVILGSSGKLTAQIRHGAPFELFLSANMRYPEALFADKFALEAPVVYAKGALAMLSTVKRDYTKGLKLLKLSSVEKIAIANPKTAPYGMAAVEALKKAKLYAMLKKKFVYGESISQTLIYATRVADMGIVAKSSLFSKHMKAYKEGENWIDVPHALYRAIDQGMVRLKKSKHNTEVQAFYNFMLGSEAREILRSFGYEVK